MRDIAEHARNMRAHMRSGARSISARDRSHIVCTHVVWACRVCVRSKPLAPMCACAREAGNARMHVCERKAWNGSMRVLGAARAEPERTLVGPRMYTRARKAWYARFPWVPRCVRSRERIRTRLGAQANERAILRAQNHTNRGKVLTPSPARRKQSYASVCGKIHSQT